MYLSDRDLNWAIKQKHLLIVPTPTPGQIGPTSIDLHLDRVEEAKVWNIAKFKETAKSLGHGNFPELKIGTFDYRTVAGVHGVGRLGYYRADACRRRGPSKEGQEELTAAESRKGN